MWRRKAAVLAAIGVVALATACEADDGETANGDTANGAVADGETVTIRAVTTGPFEDAPSTVPAGEVTLELVNEDQLAHSLRIEELDDGVEVVSGGSEGTASVELEPGTTYTFYCGVPGHRTAGMEGTFDTES